MQVLLIIYSLQFYLIIYKREGRKRKEYTDGMGIAILPQFYPEWHSN